MRRHWFGLGLGIALAVPNIASADDRPAVVFVDEAGNTVASTSTTTVVPPTPVGTSTTVTSAPGTTVATTTTSGTTVTTTSTVVTQTRVPTYAPQPQPYMAPKPPPKTTWFGLSFGAVATPFASPAYLRANDKLGTNHFRACLKPGDKKYCSSLAGFDARINIFSASGIWDYPRWVGYFRTGYRAGRAQFDPQNGGSYQNGEASGLSYSTVPLFFGGSVYAFKRFPVRPFAGAGVGIDVTRTSYNVHGQRDVTQTTVRPGIELHAGLEARITNYVAVTFEVQQLWSARRRVQNLPAMSTSALTLMGGISVSLPSPGAGQRWFR
jgi:hypothetical protein